MAKIDDYSGAAAGAVCELGVNGARTVIVARGYGYSVGGITGTIGTGLAANSSVFAARLDPGTTKRAFIERLRMQFTGVAAATVPVTVGRRLELYRGSGAAASGGTSMPVGVPKHGSGDTSEMSVANGGDMRIATTTALTITGITFETNPIATMTLTHVGGSGAFFEQICEFSAPGSQPIQLDPGQLIAIRNTIAMDAGLTWQLGVTMDWFEAPSLDFTG